MAFEIPALTCLNTCSKTSLEMGSRTMLFPFRKNLKVAFTSWCVFIAMEKSGKQEKSVFEECRTRVLYKLSASKGVPEECLPEMFPRASRIVRQDHPIVRCTRLSISQDSQANLRKCGLQTAISHKIVCQGCLPRVSSKRVLRECLLKVVLKVAHRRAC